MGSNKPDRIVHRIETELGLPSLADKLANELSPSDFSSLLTEVFSMRANNVSPPQMLGMYTQNPYTKPAACNAAQYRRLEADMLCAAEQKGIQSIILSPAALFGCCSAFGAVSQNKIISSNRSLEILSDATNMLTLYIAAGLKAGILSHADTSIHLCTTHRHIRYQAAFNSWMLPHFGIFAMVSAGKSRSSYGFEIEALLLHLDFYHDYWLQKHGTMLSASLNRRVGYKDSDGFFCRIIDAVKGRIPHLKIVIDEQENSTSYYQGLQVTLNAHVNGRCFEVGDIGFTDWTQKLLNHTSERLLISAMALDRQMPS